MKFQDASPCDRRSLSSTLHRGRFGRAWPLRRPPIATLPGPLPRVAAPQSRGRLARAGRWLASLSALVVAAPAAAQDLNGADTAWVLTSSALVLMMTLPGLALFYAGMVRSGNVLSMLAQMLGIAAIASILWVVAGYSLAFSEGNAFIGGFGSLFMSGLTVDSMSGTIPESVFAMFQMTFAVITPALIIGAFAERVRFMSVMLFSGLWLLVVYAPLVHWVWGGGWLADMGVMDFAGGLVVHLSAGVSALVAALVIGNRTGYAEQPMAPHNLPLTVAGAGLLWVGWFGFNAGSALASDGAAGMAMLVTHIAAAAGVASWSLMERLKFGKVSVLGMATGMVAGLGAITPASGFVGPASALLIGVMAGTACFWATMLIKRVWKLDDSLDVFSVHGVAGTLGTLSVAVLASHHLGAFSGYGPEGMSIGAQLWVQFVGVLSVAAYAGGVTFCLLWLVKRFTGLRTAPDAETGQDIVQHNESGYNIPSR